MSMTQIALLAKAEIPTNKQIQDAIQKLGYDFEILTELDKLIDQDGLECSIKGHQTYIKTYIDFADNVIADHEADWLKPDITNQDIAISFIWGADFAAGACIGLISLALTDLSNALIYYMDDQMKYTREMLLADTTQFLDELKKQSSENVSLKETVKANKENTQTKTTFWNKIKSIFK